MRTFVALVLLAAACTHHTTPVKTCASASEAGLSASTALALERASNMLEYEDVWRRSHSGASTGTVDSAEVQATLRAHGSEIHQCFEAALRDRNERGGRVVVRFVIAQGGRVANASIGASELSTPALACCVAERVVQWTFPQPENGSFVVVEYPFVVRLAAND